jgi:hypothetical protein
MANIPVDHISLQEAYSRFLAKYDTDGVRFTNEPIYEISDDVDCPFSRHLADYKWQEWKKITHAVHDESIEDLKRAFERGELTALYEKDGSTRLYKVEARLWIERFNMERAFYSDTFGLFFNEFADSDLFNVTPFLHEATFDKWMEHRFPKTARVCDGADKQSEIQSRLDYERMCQSRDLMHGTLRANHLPLHSATGICWQKSNSKKWLEQDLFQFAQGSGIEGMKNQLNEAVRAGLEPPLKHGQLCEYLREMNDQGSVAWHLSYGLPKLEKWFEINEAGRADSPEALRMLADVNAIVGELEALSLEADNLTNSTAAYEIQARRKPGRKPKYFAYSSDPPLLERAIEICLEQQCGKKAAIGQAMNELGSSGDIEQVYNRLSRRPEWTEAGL